MTKKQILDEAKALDPKEREELYDDLRQFVGKDELHHGNVTLRDGEDVMRGLLDELRHK